MIDKLQSEQKDWGNVKPQFSLSDSKSVWFISSSLVACSSLFSLTLEASNDFQPLCPALCNLKSAAYIYATNRGQRLTQQVKPSQFSQVPVYLRIFLWLSIVSVFDWVMTNELSSNLLCEQISFRFFFVRSLLITNVNENYLNLLAFSISLVFTKVHSLGDRCKSKQTSINQLITQLAVIALCM